MLNLILLAAGVFGLWTTIDDETGEPKSVVEVYEKDGEAWGRVVKILKGNPEATAKIDGSPKIVGLDILRNLKCEGAKDDPKAKWSGGTVLDPKKGRTYNAQVWLDGTNLVMRGSIAFIGRKQIWIPCPAAK